MIRRLPSRLFRGIIESRLEYLNNLQFELHEKSTVININCLNNEIKGTSFKTTCMDIVKQLKANMPIAAKVKYLEPSSEPQDDLLYDLSRPLEGDCKISFIYFNENAGKRIYWHSSAHILGAALEKLTNGLLCNGPATLDGFYYDVYTSELTLTPYDLIKLEEISIEIIQKNYIFKRYALSKPQALELFKYNPYKMHFISTKVPDNGTAFVYQIGDFIDLCTGPHVYSTGYIKVIQLLDTSSSIWPEDKSISLQRVYGISFPNRKLLESYLSDLSVALKKDHRKIGSSLYFWTSFSPGSAFFLPEGTIIYNNLIDFLRKEYKIRGFLEVISPNLYNMKLWKKSGHYAKYKDDMYTVNDEEDLALKPMNCPGHCLIFDYTQRSYKELPLRFAEFGVLHRNEISGSLSGLTRARRFVQDDSHIFCRKEQIKSEVLGCLDFIDYIYTLFGFTYDLELSTKPENAIGCPNVWAEAEAQLIEALKTTGKDWTVCEGQGAFYGPKIDIKLKDASGKSHQCGTIQLDFNLPKRFDLAYRTEDSSLKVFEPVTKYEDFEESDVKQGFERPVIIHRAVLGSLERFIAVLTEHYNKKWPFWLSPYQFILIPLSSSSTIFAEGVKARLTIEGYNVQIDYSIATLNKRIRDAQIAQFNYIGVIGETELESKTIDVRDRDSGQSIGKLTLEEVLKLFLSRQPKPSGPRQLMEKVADDNLNQKA